MSQKNTCYLCGFATASCRPAAGSAKLIGEVIGLYPKTFENWGICPNCDIALSKGTSSWVQQYLPRGYAPYAWKNQPKSLPRGRKQRRKGSGRIAAPVEDVALPEGDPLATELRLLPDLTNDEKVRYILHLAKEQGVLHLLVGGDDFSKKSRQEPKVGMDAVKSYTVDLSLSQRKLEKMMRSVNRDSGGTVFPPPSRVRASRKDYEAKFHVREGLATPKDILAFVCDRFGLSTSADDTGTLLVGLDFGGGTTKAVVKPYGVSGGHGCLVALNKAKDSRDVTAGIVAELQPLAQRFKLLYTADNKELQFLSGTSSNACWLCSAVEKRSNNRWVYPLTREERRWPKAEEWARSYREKCDRLKRPPAHVNGQKSQPLVSEESLLLPWLHILMGLCRNVFDHMIRRGASRQDLEQLLSDRLHIVPTKPIAGSTLERTNVLAFTGKDCRKLIKEIETVRGDLLRLPVGGSAYKVLRAIGNVHEALTSSHAQELVEASIANFRKEYVDGGFNPSLVVHLLVAHGLELYARHSDQGLRLLTEEFAERIHSQVNTLVATSQLKGDLLKQISFWNWQYSSSQVEECHTPSPRPKRARPAAKRLSPQVALSGLSSMPSSNPSDSRAVDPDYAGLSDE